MAEPKAEIADVIIDGSDPERLANFWGRLLGRPIEGRRGPYVWLQRDEHDFGLSFQRVSEPKLTKNRMHLDISAPDVHHLKERIEQLGGHRVELYDGGFLVMADPEGNEFCVVPVEPVELDDQGRTGYLEDLGP